MSGPVAGALITAAAICLSAAVALGLGKFHSNWATKAARTKATFDALNQKAWDRDYIRAKALFIAARNADGGGALVEEAKKHRADPDPHNLEMSTGLAIRLVMNDYELMFIGIEEGVLDEGLYKLWHMRTIVLDYQKTKSYVEWVRDVSGNKRLFEVFQRNASQWERELARA